MQAEAIPLGERLITQQADLDRQFASKSVTPASLQAATAEIGATQGALRLAHLHYHPSLRGYQASEGHGHGSKGHH